MLKKMESKKSHPRWWDSFVGPNNSNSKWVQDNLEEMNRNVRRMLKLIEDSDADSFAKKVEMYYQRRQELINLVGKCYRLHCSLAEHIIMRQQSFRTPFLIQILFDQKAVTLAYPMCKSESEPGDSSISDYSDTQSDDDDVKELHEGTDELEAELRDMIERLYIQLEGDRVVSKLQGGILGHEDNTCDYDGEFREVKESVSSDVDKALLEESLELLGEIGKLWKETSYLEKYNNEANKRCQLLEEALSEARAERMEAETLLAPEVEQLKASIVKKCHQTEDRCVVC